jgi:hypothetical protein
MTVDEYELKIKNMKNTANRYFEAVSTSFLGLPSDAFQREYYILKKEEFMRVFDIKTYDKDK